MSFYAFLKSRRADIEARYRALTPASARLAAAAADVRVGRGPWNHELAHGTFTFSDVHGAIDRLEYLYLSACLIAGLTLLLFALRDARAVTARRQLRWIAWGTALGGTPFALVYALP